MCKQEPIKRIEYDLVTLQIWSDDYTVNPRTDFDNLGHMICWHSRYNLGDDHNFEDAGDLMRCLTREINPQAQDRIDDLEDYDGELSWEQWEIREAMVEKEVKEIISKTVSSGAIVLPLYLYDHSGIGMSTHGHSYPFNCPWDSGQAGWIYVTHEEIRKEFGWKRLTKSRLEKIADILVAEVEVYHQYISDQIYLYNVLDRYGNVLDSCGGFYGYEYALEEGSRSASHYNILEYCLSQRDRMKEDLQHQKEAEIKDALIQLQVAGV